MSSGIYEGRSIFYYESGAIKNKGVYSKGKRAGLFEDFYQDGRIKITTNYVDDKQDGFLYEYDSSEVITSKQHFQKGLANGECLFYYPDGKLEMKINFTNGKEDGDFFQYYENGSLKGRREYSKGILKSIISYNQDGTIRGMSISARNTLDSLSKISR